MMISKTFMPSVLMLAIITVMVGCGGVKVHGSVVHAVASTDFFNLFDSVRLGPNHGGFFEAHPGEHF